MTYSLENGYLPRSFDQILAAVIVEINEQFNTTYDAETFVGTEFYRYSYAGIQLTMLAETRLAELSAKLTDFIRTANEKINLPKSTIDGFTSSLLAPETEGGLGLVSTIKDVSNLEAGYLFCAVDVDPLREDYATIKQEIINRMGDWLTVGQAYSGTESGSRVALNGQVFNYSFDLPTPIDILIRATITASKNTKNPILNENQVRDILNANLIAFYKLGLDFEPEKYLEISRDLPFASNIFLEYSEDSGASWLTDPRLMAYSEKINVTAPATISII
tara:strand:- start:788 stop:1615 length:828 start_codon:yes stop_codon:yes gene_type:complete